MSKEQKDKFIAKQLSFRQNWYITGTLNAPWTTIRLENLISRLKNIIIDHVAACMGKVGAITPAMRSLFTAEVTEANQACIADNEQINGRQAQRAFNRVPVHPHAGLRASD